MLHLCPSMVLSVFYVHVTWKIHIELSLDFKCIQSLWVIQEIFLSPDCVGGEEVFQVSPDFCHQETNLEPWVIAYFHTIMVVVVFCIHLKCNGVSLQGWCGGLNRFRFSLEKPAQEQLALCRCGYAVGYSWPGPWNHFQIFFHLPKSTCHQV